MGNNYNNWLSTASAHGISNYEASQMPQARAAHEQDQVEEARVRGSASKLDFIEQFLTNRVAEGVRTMGWLDQEEYMAAISDPLYDKSEAYRSACAEITNKTDASVIGVSAKGTAADGTVLQLGRVQEDGKATVASMRENLYRDMVIEEMGKMDLSTAKGRFQYHEFLTDPKNAEAIAYMQGLVTSDEQNTNNIMLELKAEGVRQTYVTPVTGAIDVPEGVTVYEEGNGEQS